MKLPAARLVEEPFGPELKAEGLKSSRCGVSERNLPSLKSYGKASCVEVRLAIRVMPKL